MKSLLSKRLIYTEFNPVHRIKASMYGERIGKTSSFSFSQKSLANMYGRLCPFHHCNCADLLETQNLKRGYPKINLNKKFEIEDCEENGIIIHVLIQPAID